MQAMARRENRRAIFLFLGLASAFFDVKQDYNFGQINGEEAAW